MLYDIIDPENRKHIISIECIDSDSETITLILLIPKLNILHKKSVSKMGWITIL